MWKCLWQGDIKALKEQLRQKEEQLQANQQQSALLAAELRDASRTRDRTMSELYHMKVEADSLRQAKTDAQAQCVQLEILVEQMKTEAKEEAVRDNQFTCTLFFFFWLNYIHKSGFEHKYKTNLYIFVVWYLFKCNNIYI